MQDEDAQEKFMLLKNGPFVENGFYSWKIKTSECYKSNGERFIIKFGVVK
jgi:hypothetical protein